MRDIKRAYDYEADLGNGRIQIYKGHPSYCPKLERHDAHMFRYEFRLRDGSIVKGSYLCEGRARKEFPTRYVDMPMPDKPCTTDQPRDTMKPDERT